MTDYDVLGLKNPPYERKEIRAAFMKKAKLTHPDKKGGTAAGFRAVREAYNRLIHVAGTDDSDVPVPKTDGWSDDWKYTSDDPPWMYTAPPWWNPQPSDTVEIESDSDIDSEAEQTSDDDTSTACEDNDDYEEDDGL
jgi:hypothetical protein